MTLIFLRDILAFFSAKLIHFLILLDAFAKLIITSLWIPSEEIIEVDKSPEQNIKTILKNEGYNKVISKRIKIINSLPNHLPKAFNLGVKTATKKYIALFHDDCEILENRWVEKLTVN